MAFYEKNLLNLNLTILSFIFVHGFNNHRIIRSNDVLVNSLKELISFVHHWLHHK